MNLHELAAIIQQRQQLPWDNAKLNDYAENRLEEWFEYINKPDTWKDCWFYQGDLYRIHTPYSGLSTEIDKTKERIVSKIYEDDSCNILPITQYSDKIVAFSKSYDFTTDAFYKVDERGYPDTFIHINTGDKYGIDVNKLYKSLGYEQTRYSKEYEVLFPLSKTFMIKEYICSPKQFLYYNRSKMNYEED